MSAVVAVLLTLALAAGWVRSYFARDRVKFERIVSNDSGFDMIALQSYSSLGAWQLFYSRSEAYPEDPTSPTNIFVHGKQFQDGTRWNHESAAPRPLQQGASYGPEFLARRGLLWQRNKFERAGRVTHTRQSSTYVEVRFWMIVLPAAGASALLIWRLRRRWRIVHRVQRGLCVTCGYDLRESRERCPECGAIPEAAPA